MSCGAHARVDAALASYSVAAMTAKDDTRTLAARILDWYEAMGADVALAEAPPDWLSRGDQAPGAQFALRDARPAQPAPTSQPSEQPRAPQQRMEPASRAEQPRQVRQFARTAAPAGETEAGKRVRQARTLQELRAMLEGFEGCGLKATAKNLCFFRGAEHAPLMVIGEAPGREEDLEGKPFVGRAGMLFDKMLAAMGMSEADAHITNIVYWRPPGNRTPTPQEALACRPFLERQVELVAPDVLLILGGAAAKQLYDVTDGIMRLRGKWRKLQIGGHEVRAMATLHPAYLLRTPAAKGMAWRDLLAVKDALRKEQ